MFCRSPPDGGDPGTLADKFQSPFPTPDGELNPLSLFCQSPCFPTPDGGDPGTLADKFQSPTIRWRKGELIGSGAFGQVYMGMNLDSGELLAVKQVSIAANSASKEKTQMYIRELEEEAKLLKNLSHANIVRYFGIIREEGTLNILLEYVPGGSISSLLGQFGPFPEEVIRVYTKQLLLGLDYLHKNGIMHRDIKGANILVDNKGCIKLADFGASKQVVELANGSGAKSMKGTPYWMAPEVILQTGHSFSADIWSVGCTVIEMATGKPPWSQQYREEVSALFYIGTTKSHPPIPDNMSLEAKDLLLKCLHKEPEMRPSASDLLQHPFVTNVSGGEGNSLSLMDLSSPPCKFSVNVESNNSEVYSDQEQQTRPILEKFEKLCNIVKDLKEENILLCNEVKTITAVVFPVSEVFSAFQTLGEKHEALKNKFHLVCSERRRLYKQVIKLKGNIRVFCRCRPFLNHDDGGSTSVVDFEENKLKIIASDSSKRQFKFDHVFRPEDNQEAVFAQILPLVVSVLDGFNVCIFAYGQTGTGKTFTMEGTAENRGVNYRTLEELLKVSERRSDIMKYQVFLSMLEVYNDKIRDLLVEDTEQPAKKLEIQQSEQGTQEVVGLSEVAVYKTVEVWELVKSRSRVNANELSSRSHCLLRVTVGAENLVNGQRTRNHLWLVDLAGSERVGKIETEGERLKESLSINKSLSALGDVISALASKTSHIPYRNSKLTHILESSLGDDCMTLVFVQISPSPSDLGETLCSLNFASRVRGVEHKQTHVTDLFKYKQLAEKAKHNEKETKKLQDLAQSLRLRSSAKRHLARTLKEKVRDLENQLSEERKTRQKQENRAHSSLKPGLTTIPEEGPPLGPSTTIRLPLRRITNFVFSPPSPAPSTLKPNYSNPLSTEDKENLSKPLTRARRGSIPSKPATHVLMPKRRPSIHLESTSGNTAAVVGTSGGGRMRNAIRQSFVWRVCGGCSRTSPRKRLVWSPLKSRRTKTVVRKAFV